MLHPKPSQGLRLFAILRGGHQYALCQTGESGRESATANTKVGVGTTKPAQALEVQGGHIRLGDVNGAIEFTSAIGINRSFIQGTFDNLDVLGGPLATRFLDNAYTRANMIIRDGGNVGIGTQAPEERLHVIGNVKVSGNMIVVGNILYGSNSIDMPDYVFEPGYPLMPLETLGEYVASEKHLPNMPSAADAKKQGLNLTELQMKLLKKVEELTLYAVQQERTIREQRAKNTDLEARLAAVERMLLHQLEQRIK